MRQLARYARILLLATSYAVGLATHSLAAQPLLEIQIGYLGYRPDPGPLLSNVIAEPEDAGLRVAELAYQAGIPAGVFNVVPGGGKEAGEPLGRHPDVAMVSFTGRT